MNAVSDCHKGTEPPNLSRREPKSMEQHMFDTQTLYESNFRYVFKFKKVDSKFDRLWHMKTTARESLKDWLLVTDVSPQMSEICANACSELIENCIKYSSEGSVTDVAIRVANAVITIETINSSSEQHYQELMQTLSQINSGSDLKQLFVEKLVHSAVDKSQLGLLKIALETKGVLSLVPNDNDHILHLVVKMNI